MDMPPPPIITPVSQVNILEYDTTSYDEEEWFFFLSHIDRSEYPQKVKQYAKDNNCRYLEEILYWSWKKYKNKGGVYHCVMNNRGQYIFDNGKKLRFAKRWETYKIRHTKIYE